MITKHFFKVLMIFLIMIALGLVGIFAVNNLKSSGDSSNDTSAKTEVAE
ncbi:MAG: hypothetical protein WCT44_03915 [Candidatus Paceibacterota bacterium]